MLHVDEIKYGNFTRTVAEIIDNNNSMVKKEKVFEDRGSSKRKLNSDLTGNVVELFVQLFVINFEKRVNLLYQDYKIGNQPYNQVRYIAPHNL